MPILGPESWETSLNGEFLFSPCHFLFRPFLILRYKRAALTLSLSMPTSSSHVICQMDNIPCFSSILHSKHFDLPVFHYSGTTLPSLDTSENHHFWEVPRCRPPSHRRPARPLPQAKQIRRQVFSFIFVQSSLIKLQSHTCILQILN